MITPSTPSSEYTVGVQEVVGDLVLIAAEPVDSELNTVNLYRWPSSTLIKVILTWLQPEYTLITEL